MYSLTNVPSRQTIEDVGEAYSYNAAMDLKTRIYSARKDAGLSQAELADRVGKSRGAVAQWESGDVRPRHSTIVEIAKATNKPLSWLENGIEDERTGLMVIGEVAAGLWKEGTVEYLPQGMPVAPHPDYPAGSQRLYQVRGTSVNKTVDDGEYIHCVDIHAGGVIVESGDLVVVCRMEHGLTEYTAKRYVVEGGQKILRPDSTDSQWQADLDLSGDDGVSIKITDIVIAKWSPIRRRRL